MIRIGIVDDHPAMVLGTSAIINIQSDMHVAAAGATVGELLDHAVDLDVVLLDLVLADDSNMAVNIRELTTRGIVVLAYTSGERVVLVQQAVRSGVAGVIRKSESPEVLISAIRSAIAGETVATLDWAAALEEDQSFVRAELTPREAEVLSMYASGATAEAVATALFISRYTVNDHIRRIRAKYAALGRDATDKIALSKRAVEDGLL
ncbi:LuxR C-terminal-related transcriptional regulator [Microbacterium paraoxydans]|uniref:LuxR C-terminal-related transcriptional regulator n=1 Tax=Microbacterium paraoxydans TaxID=199592 RepID=UPI001CF9987C|nr:LuxR C-terminal-related transcriptional regulator [Microbacterium paraoxydans]